MRKDYRISNVLHPTSATLQIRYHPSRSGIVRSRAAAGRARNTAGRDITSGRPSSPRRAQGRDPIAPAISTTAGTVMPSVILLVSSGRSARRLDDERSVPLRLGP